MRWEFPGRDVAALGIVARTVLRRSREPIEDEEPEDKA